MNHNVKVALWWSLWENISASIRSGDVLSALIFLLTRSNTTVGIIQGVNGVVQMLVALPAGWLADRHRRDSMLRAGAAVGAVAGGVLAYALAMHPTVYALGIAMALLGCYRGIYSAALEAIFADSIQHGRSGLYTRKYAITVLASSFGPWLSLVLFLHLGNRWDPYHCRLVLLSGLTIMVGPLILMCLFDDDKALVQHRQPSQQSATWRSPPRQQQPQDEAREPLLSVEDGRQHANGAGQQQQQQQANGVSVPVGLAGADAASLAARAAAEVLAPAEGRSACGQADGQADGGEPGSAAPGLLQPDGWQADVDDAGSTSGASCGLPPGLLVTLLISVSDFIGAFASGMTLKYFALFFMQVAGMSPVAVSLIGAVSPLGVSAASLACQPLSKLLGRVQISLITRCLDVLLLLTLASLPCDSPPAKHLLVVVHLARMAVANATRPLMRSVLMDFVPRRHRGKVNAIDSVRTFSWSGSAAVGGFLIEKIGFRGTFLVTAGIKLGALLPLLGLLAFVPDGICVPSGSRLKRLARAERWHAAAAAAGTAEPLNSRNGCTPSHSAAGMASNGLSEPLLKGGASAT